MDSLIRLRQGWKTLVGEDISKHCHVQFIKNNKLYIKVDSPSWKAELTLMKTLLLKKIQDSGLAANIQDLILTD